MPLNQDTLLAAATAGPRLDPQSAYGISQTTTDPSIAGETAQATQAYARAVTAVATLSQQDPGQQRQLWKALTRTEQQMYTAAGYTPPAEEHHDGGFFSALGDAIVPGLSFVQGKIHDVTGLPMVGVDEALHAVGSGLRFTQHAFRTAASIDDLTADDHWGAEAWGNAFDPSLWAKAWRETEHGERSFLPSHVTKIEDSYAPDVVQYARMRAEKVPDDQIIASAPPEQQQELAARLRDDKQIAAAASDFEHAKISFGRQLVGEQMWHDHPALATAISGGGDAVFDVVADPVIWGGKFVKAVQLAPYIVTDAGRLGEVLAKPGAQRMFTEAADALNSGGAAQLMRRFPKFSTIAQQLVDEDVNTVDKMTEWFQGQAGRDAIMQGRVGGFAQRSVFSGPPGVVVPNLSRTEAVAMPIKEELGRAINWAADHHVPLAPTVERISKLAVPRAGRLDPGSKEALTWVQRIADYALPQRRADELVNVFAETRDPGRQFQIYKGLVSEVMDAMKVPEEYKAQFFDRLEGAASVHAYGVEDSMLVEGQSMKVGFTQAHVEDAGWSIPDFRELRMQADRMYVMQRIYGTVNSDLATGFMDRWKPVQLLRIGMPIRTGGEELVAAMLREGPLGLLRGRLADSALAEGPLSPVHPLAAITDRMTRHLPQPLIDAIHTPSELAGAILGDRARRAFRFVEGRLAGQDYMNAAKTIAELFPDALPEEISAVHSHGAGFLGDGATVNRMTREGVNARPVYMTASDEFRPYLPTENLMTNIWHKNLDDYSRDPLMRAAFEHASAGEAEQTNAVLDVLEGSGMARARRQAVRNFQTSDGRMVGVDATQDEALREWATVAVTNANNVTSDAAGLHFDDIVDMLRAGDVPSIEHLNSIPVELRPTSVTGPDMMPVYGEGKWGEIQKNGFGYIGRMINWIAREPMYVHNMATSLREVETFRSLYAGVEGATAEHVDRQLAEVASERALVKTLPFIHDPKVRSQFAEDARNLAPFMFAQEQFIKRFARTFAHSPEAFREAQLTMMGLRHAGIVKKDAEGNDYFMYPAVTFAQDELSRAVELTTGHKVMLPIPVGFSGQVRFATPGTERLAAPSWGPFVAIPMNLLTRRFPELTELEQTVVGERGAGRSIWEQIAPASVARIYHAATDNPETSPQMHSAYLQATQYLEATGHGLPEDASPVEKEEYVDRVKSWTRVLMFTRAIYGFSAPAAPELQIDPAHMHEELTTLMGQLPAEQAIAEFMRRHPDATAYTVFQSKSESGAQIPATEEAVRFMEQHAEFLRNYPQAGSWFLPQAPGDYSQAAYREQLALHLRHKKTNDEFYADLKFAEAAPDYFATKDARDAALTGAKGNRDLTAQINQQWADFSTSYLKMHPVFEERLLSPDGQLRRQRTIGQLRDALADPNLPASPQNVPIANLLATYDALQSYLVGFTGRRDRLATEAKATARQQFIEWAHGYVLEHPEVQGLYDSAFRLEVGDS